MTTLKPVNATSPLRMAIHSPRGLKIFIPVLFLLFFSQMKAQKEANNWVFGFGAAVSWNTGSPVFFSGTVMQQDEGCSSISDHNGQLLFYTDGISVWNRNNTLMPNGTGLAGNSSSTQSSLVVRLPGSQNIYYIFTTDLQGGSNGFEYSEVDMTADGGLGDVTVKNTMVYTPSSEKLTATAIANGSGYWIATHDANTNQFYLYQLTAAGFNSTALTIAIGTAFVGQDIGYMKFSPDGSKLALGNYEPSVQIFDFNNSTGALSNPIQDANVTWPYGCEFSPSGRFLYVANDFGGGCNLLQYDLQAGSPAAIVASKTTIVTSAITFGDMQIAPDSKIYICVENQQSLNVINNPNLQGAACNYQVAAVPFSGGATGQLGLPNFVTSYFVIRNGFTSATNCINDTVTFTLDSATTNSLIWNFGDPASGTADTSTSHAPSHVFSGFGTYTVTLIETALGVSDTITEQLSIYRRPVVNLGNDTNLCNGNTVLLNGGNYGARYLWQNGSTSQFFTASDSGLYSVVVTDSNGCIYADSVYITNNCNTGFSTSRTCANDSVRFTTLGALPDSVHWNFGDPGSAAANTSTQVSATHFFSGPGTYVVTLIDYNTGGVTDTFIQLYTVHQIPVVNLGNDTNLCNGASVVLNAGNYGATYSWQDGSNAQFFTASDSGKYTVVVTDSNGCLHSDSVQVTNYCNQGFTSLVTCSDDSITTFTPTGNYAGSVLWNFGDPSSGPADTSTRVPATHVFSNGGAFTVSFTDFYPGGITETTTQQVVVHYRPIVNLGPDTNLCNGQTVVLNAGSYGASYRWQDSSTGQFLSVTDTGKYSVTVIDSNGCSYFDSVLVTLMCTPKLVVPSAFTPNGDGKNDFFVPRYINTPVKYEVHVYNRWGEMVFESNNITVGWDGNFKGKAQPPGTYLYYIQYTFTGQKQQGLRGAVELLR